MTYYRTLVYIQYSLECPDDVSPLRWKGILKFLKTNNGIEVETTDTEDKGNE